MGPVTTGSISSTGAASGVTSAGTRTSRPTSTASAASEVTLGIYEKALVGTTDWDELFTQVRTAGFSFTDLSVDESDERLARLGWSSPRRRRVAQAAADTGVRIGGVCLSAHRRFGPGSADPAVRDQARSIYHQGIDLCVDLGAPVLQVAGYFAHGEPRNPQARSRYVEMLGEVLPHAAEAGVILGIENVDGHDIAAVQDVVAVLDELPSPWLQAYADIGNIAEHGGDAATELASGLARIVALHLKDVRPGQPRRVPMGQGVTDFDGAFATLAAARWSGRMMIEMWNDDAKDSLERCVAARHFIEDRLDRAGISVRTPRWEAAA